ncbi:hypothetical protein B0H63DRAFT_507983 [Podospora didyma]|uniref:Uncharacterized protein n=1 Tax=Podospora didyma TaxID=330526 RepID=A0AAE0U4I8_9PEZI|nr:hypothetical protein B0H63DRAFT_507983 [Podospora didyma]
MTCYDDKISDGNLGVLRKFSVRLWVLHVARRNDDYNLMESELVEKATTHIHSLVLKPRIWKWVSLSFYPFMGKVPTCDDGHQQPSGGISRNFYTFEQACKTPFAHIHRSVKKPRIWKYLRHQKDIMLSHPPIREGAADLEVGFHSLTKLAILQQTYKVQAAMMDNNDNLRCVSQSYVDFQNKDTHPHITVPQHAVDTDQEVKYILQEQEAEEEKGQYLSNHYTAMIQSKPGISSRLKSMLMDVIDLGCQPWNSPSSPFMILSIASASERGSASRIPAIRSSYMIPSPEQITVSGVIPKAPQPVDEEILAHGPGILPASSSC